MRLLSTKTLELERFADQAVPPYAILSHTHGEGEVTINDIGSEPTEKNAKGWEKVLGCVNKARQEGFDYVWIDTCCIDGSSSADVSEAINSMFRWYQTADVCYAYLSDVPFAGPETSSISSLASTSSVNNSFFSARWFSRGWTLQELLAPSEVVFFSTEWKEIGTRDSLCEILNQITRIDTRALRTPGAWREYSLAQRMSWASRRKTLRIEDEAYCLMGLFGVTMPILYGEGRKAFTRLQIEILQTSEDQTILAWTHADSPRALTGMLARSPADFRKCAGARVTRDDEEDKKRSFFSKPTMLYEIVKGCVKLDAPVLGPFAAEKDHVLENTLRGKVNIRDGDVSWKDVVIVLLPGCSKGDNYTGLLLKADESGVFQRLHYPTMVSVLKAVRNTELLSQKTIYVRASDEWTASYRPRPTQGCVIRSHPSPSSGYELFLTLPKVDRSTRSEGLWHTEESSGGEQCIRVTRCAPVALMFKSFETSLPYVMIIIDWLDGAVAPHSFVGGLQDLLSIFDQSSKRLTLPAAAAPGPALRALDSENWVVVKCRRGPRYATVNIHIGPREELLS
jgi:hypothetical protein